MAPRQRFGASTGTTTTTVSPVMEELPGTGGGVDVNQQEQQDDRPLLTPSTSSSSTGFDTADSNSNISNNKDTAASPFPAAITNGRHHNNVAGDDDNDGDVDDDDDSPEKELLGCISRVNDDDDDHHHENKNGHHVSDDDVISSNNNHHHVLASAESQQESATRKLNNHNHDDMNTQQQQQNRKRQFHSLLATEAEIAREHHDYFNIFALLFVTGATLVNWDCRKLLLGYAPEEAYIGDRFFLMWGITCFYFVADLVWVSVVPICVKSPNTIIAHHFIAIAYLCGPIAYPEFRWFTGACLSVEINTWFLILRRVLYKRQEQIPQAITQLVSFCFYVSWIIIRLFIYPAILLAYFQKAYDRVMETGILFHVPMIFIVVHFFLCILNLKWSYDLFLPIIRKHFFEPSSSTSPNNKAAGGVVSSGL